MKKFENLITYNCYRYAPESFNLIIKGIGKVKLNSEITSKLGNLYICGNKKELEKQIKIFIRNKTILTKELDNIKVAIKVNQNNKKDYVLLQDFDKCSRYDIQGKLRQYKNLKENYNANNSPITITEGKMTSYGKFEKTKEYVPQVELLKRVILI